VLDAALVLSDQYVLDERRDRTTTRRLVATIETFGRLGQDLEYSTRVEDVVLTVLER